MKYVLFILGRGWISGIPPSLSLTVPMVGNKEKPKLGKAKFCLHNMPFILGRGRISGFPLFQWFRWPDARKIQGFSRMATGRRCFPPIFVDLRVDMVGGRKGNLVPSSARVSANFSVSNGKSGFGFLL